jgi:IclR family transcriptional regulator, KDG regulon repressor
MPNIKRTGRAGVKSLEKGLDILGFAIQYGPRFTVTDICKHLRLPQSTAYRLLGTFARHGFLTLGFETYEPGPRLFALASLVLGQMELRDVALEPMKKLSLATAHSVFLFVCAETEAVCIGRVESPNGLQLPLKIGSRRPLHGSGIARVFMAALSDTELDAFLARPLPRLTPFTMTDPDRLRQEIRKTRERGYSISTNEFVIGARSLGVPIRDFSSTVIAALGIGGTPDTLPDTEIPRIAALARAAGDEISRRLGYSGAGQEELATSVKERKRSIN